ncbi:MAG TPA: hypothetical protein VM262_21140 [Acidimicrobiales bacterium]|nr:hypothetical protein [Acidimicrobiales bacterium]
MSTTEQSQNPIPAAEPRRLRPLARGLPSFDPSSPALTWIGLALAAIGFGVIAFSWGKVAGLLDVSLQMPYVVSGGLTGLGLVMVGMTAVNVAARRQDAVERARQVEQLESVLRELQETLERDR